MEYFLIGFVGVIVADIIGAILSAISSLFGKKGKLDNVLENTSENGRLSKEHERIRQEQSKEHEQIRQEQKELSLELSKNLSERLTSIREDQIRVQEEQKSIKEKIPDANHFIHEAQSIANLLLKKTEDAGKLEKELAISQEKTHQLEKELEKERIKNKELEKDIDYLERLLDQKDHKQDHGWSNYDDCDEIDR